MGSIAGAKKLDTYVSYDLTPVIGTLFTSQGTGDAGDARPALQLSAILDSDEAIAELAKFISERGVVFFKDQDLNIEQQRKLGEQLGKLSWNLPQEKTSTLHVHPISETTPELGKDISVISSQEGIARSDYVQGAKASNGWHSDITFEPVPSDYSILKMLTIPKVGGDTLWASGCEAYDRLSPALRAFLETLHAEHDGSYFVDYAKKIGVPLQTLRGAPENAGTDLKCIHPLVRTNPVTGYKSLYVNKSFTRRIIELTQDESDKMLEHLFSVVADNHDLQVRYRWGLNDIAIWDNRSTLHTATNDYGDAARQGNRVVSLGEKPYFDPNSKSRRQALAAGA